MHPVSTIQRWWPVLAWAGLILGMSSVPGSRLDDVGVQVPDKLVHAVEYGVLGGLILRSSSGGRPLRRRDLLVAVLAAAVFGIIDENYQRLTPQRETSAADWAADVAGAATGVLLLALRAGWPGRGRRRSG